MKYFNTTNKIFTTFGLLLIAKLILAQGSSNALSFDGNNDYVDLGNPTLWNTTFAGSDKQFSLEAFVKPNSLSGQKLVIEKNADSNCSANERQFNFYLDNGTLGFSYHFATSGCLYRVLKASTTLATNEWSHIAITYDGSVDSNNGLDRVKMYVNGEAENVTMVSTCGTLGDIPTGNARLGIGERVDASGNACANVNPKFFDGEIDEVRIWNDIRTQTELKDNMCRSISSSDPGLVGYWQMNTGAGITVVDATTNGNDGTAK